MNITRIRLTDFRRHGELDIELKPGLNIVRGPNEAGKSTIQRAIELGLFRKPTFTAAELEELRPWHKPDADPTIELDFDDEGEHGTLRKVFARQRGTVEMTWKDETLTDPAAVETTIAQLTGLPSEKFMRATASIHHAELTGLDKDENTLRDRLQQSMSGADRGTQTALKKLEDAIRRYKTEGTKNPGYLKQFRAEVDRLREQKRSGEAALEQLEADRRVLGTARTTRSALDDKIAEQAQGVARAERAVQLTTRQADAARRYTLYRRASELREEITRLEGSHPSNVALSVLKTSVDHLRQLEFKLSEMRAELAAEPDLSGYDVAIPTPRWQPSAVAGGVLVAVALIVVAVSVAVIHAPLIGIVVAIAALGGAAAAFRVTRRERSRLGDVRMQNELRESEIARRLQGRSSMAEKVRQAEQDKVVALSSISQPDLATADRVLTAETEHVAQIANLRAEYRGLLSDDSTGDDVAVLRDRAAAEVDECKHTLAGMGEIGRDPDRYMAAYNQAVKRLAPERDAAMQAEANAEARVTNNAVDAEQVAAAAEALMQAEESLADAERRLRIYEDVLATLTAAERGTMKKAARFLEQRMARDVERITGGRYRRLRVDEQTLTFTVYSPELDNWIDVRRLSQGTLDQLYLCARLGIVRQVTEPGTPPLIFDDPFGTFDPDRAERALKMLKELASEFQVIFMTASDRYDAVADNIVALPAPQERDDPEPVVASSTGEAMSMWSTATLPEPEAAPAVAAVAAPVAAAAPVVAAAVTPAAAPAAIAATAPLQPAAGEGNGHTNGNGRPAAVAPTTTTAPPAPIAPLWPEER
jgi:DNA repair exonuclease SbcCD ATPase subunit